ncbi:hypothetical protein A8W25_26205 [Streptomyces sp. ERV7]|uniref:hypothetical protein n=1 Tax=Streptomyces sp. ERV7 TaxID=1322334 RepID=UPI0007F3AFC4|nr:hypothetical protein [Streptomyces sp. ERV7]OAR23025.1 hypothetical protein A8W25_26205 [Streptomyces sp. ERV7]
MTSFAERNGTSRRAINAKKRQSRRPSRLGAVAGATPKPDRLKDEEAGFPTLLKRAWEKAVDAPDLRTAVNALLTLDGHVPGDVQLRALRTADEAALKVLCGISWREEDLPAPVRDTKERPAFLGELGLTTTGRIVIRVPSQGSLADEENLVDGVIDVPWSAQDLLDYESEVNRAAARYADQVVDCRQWLAALGTPARDELLETVRESALRTAPFVLHQEGKLYTNFREGNNLIGKTLWAGHPSETFSSLLGVEMERWSDHDAMLVVCLTLLVRSAGAGRIEEANGTQLTLDHLAFMLERTRGNYNAVPGGEPVPAAPTHRVEALNSLAMALRERRVGHVLPNAQLYREIHGALMHKIERLAGPYGEASKQREAELSERLSERLPVTGATFEELSASLAASPGWLARPHGDFGTGLEALVYETVAGATDVFEADFAMSRGMRSIPELMRALREQSWTEITKWDITDFFCCVVPAPAAKRHYEDSVLQLADNAWAMSSRMQYNSWHFIAGNLPKVPAVVERDHFIPPTIPDVAFYSDQHHHGHVATKVRFSIRSPQSVEVMDRKFNGFMDLRLLRCDGRPFDESDLLAAHRTSGFIAGAMSAAAALVAEGEDIEVTAFDSEWHLQSVQAAAANARQPHQVS